jgi:hypothetical protein
MAVEFAAQVVMIGLGKVAACMQADLIRTMVSVTLPYSPPTNLVIVEEHLPCSLELSAAIGNRQVQYCELAPKV